MKHIIIFIAILFAIVGVQASEIEKAYKREFIFLNSQKNSLLKQKAKAVENYKKTIVRLRKENDSLKSRWLGQNKRKEKLVRNLSEMELSWEDAQEKKDILGSILRQGSETFNLKFENENKSEKLKTILEKSLAELQEKRKVSSKKAPFFLANGEEVQGQVVSVGSIASFGKHKNQIFNLVPAGSGKLRVWKDVGAQASDLFANKIPQSLPLFVYENTNQIFEAKKEKTIFEFIKGGGIIGYVIIAIGFLSLVLSAIRYINLKRQSALEKDFDQKSATFLKSRNKDSLLEYLKERSGAIPRAMKVVVENIDKPDEEVESAVSENFIREQKQLEKYGSLILVIASIAPLLGLLGTVTGMISTFDIITEHGTGNPKLLSGGISEALITTELGLIVAIPVLLIGQVLKSWSNKIQLSIEEASLKVWNHFKG